MLLLRLLLLLPLDKPIESAESEHSLDESRCAPLPEERSPWVDTMLSQLVLHEVGHLEGVKEQHARDDVGLYGPTEACETRAKVQLHHLTLPEPPSLAVAQEGGTDDGELDGKQSGRWQKLLHRDVRLVETDESFFIQLDDTFTSFSVGCHGWVERDAVCLAAAGQRHAVEVDAGHLAVVRLP